MVPLETMKHNFASAELSTKDAELELKKQLTNDTVWNIS